MELSGNGCLVNLTSLTLNKNSIGEAGASALSQALTANSSLTTLELRLNNIGNAGASSLSQALTANSSLTSLDLGANSIGDAGASALFQALSANSSLISLHLDENSIGEADVSSLFQALKANSSLAILNLRWNSIGDAGASSLSQALTANSSLASLDLSCNSIGETGVSSLSQAPLLAMLVMYTRIYLVARYQAKRIGRNYASDIKAAKTIAVVIGSFVICWLPFFMVVLSWASPSLAPLPTTFFNIAKWLEYLNSCLNPIIYTCLNRTYRNAFRKLFRRCRSKIMRDNRDPTLGTKWMSMAETHAITQAGRELSSDANGPMISNGGAVEDVNENLPLKDAL